MKTVSRLIGVATAMFAASAAHAVPITVLGSGANVLVDQSAPVTGSFDINAAVAALGFVSPYSVASASMTFLFQDNTDARSVTTSLQYSTTYRGQDVCTGSLQSTCSPRYYWIDTYSQTTIDPSETALANVGAQSASATSSMQQSYIQGSVRPTGEYSCSVFGCGYDMIERRRCGPLFNGYVCDGPWPVYEQYGYFSQLSSGDFSITLGLDAGSLLDLATDGLLDFSISSLVGNFNFLSASLTAEVNEGTPSEPLPATPVPEPASLALMGFGLLLVARRKAASMKLSAAAVA